MSGDHHSSAPWDVRAGGREERPEVGDRSARWNAGRQRPRAAAPGGGDRRGRARHRFGRPRPGAADLGRRDLSLLTAAIQDTGPVPATAARPGTTLHEPPEAFAGAAPERPRPPSPPNPETEAPTGT